MSFLEPVLGPRKPNVDSADLRRAAQREHQLEVQKAGLSERFDWAVVYVATEPDSNRIVLHVEDGQQWCHAYSEFSLLPDARYGNDEVWHKHLPGDALRRQLPNHVGIELDHGHPHARVIARPKARPITTDGAE
ncbi:hypothetical protein JNUCC0626_32280 [Lentzea sp. JNUCC 0626]|uniref:hypothetical protein n=1 Tax=Lentzea sp. JNUCC 0626 TaxID=3367513 RepID=UPI003747C600